MEGEGEAYMYWGERRHEEIMCESKFDWMKTRRTLIASRNSEIECRKLWSEAVTPEAIFMYSMKKEFINPLMAVFKLEVAAWDRALENMDDMNGMNICHMLINNRIDLIVAGFWKCLKAAYERNMLHKKCAPMEYIMCNYPKLGNMLHNLKLLFVWEGYQDDPMAEVGEREWINNVYTPNTRYGQRGQPCMNLGMNKMFRDLFGMMMFECLNIKSASGRYFEGQHHPVAMWYWGLITLGLHLRIKWDGDKSPLERGHARMDAPERFGPNRIWVACDMAKLTGCVTWMKESKLGQQHKIDWKRAKTGHDKFIFTFDGVTREEATQAWRFVHRIPIPLYMYADEFVKGRIEGDKELHDMTMAKRQSEKWVTSQNRLKDMMLVKRQPTLTEVFNMSAKAKSDSEVIDNVSTEEHLDTLAKVIQKTVITDMSVSLDTAENRRGSSSGEEDNSDVDSNYSGKSAHSAIWASQSMDKEVQARKEQEMERAANQKVITEMMWNTDEIFAGDYGFKKFKHVVKLMNNVNRVCRMERSKSGREIRQLKRSIAAMEEEIRNWRNPKRDGLRRLIRRQGGMERRLWSMMTWL